MIKDYSGFWTGEIMGTNQGGFTFDLKQERDKVSGKAVLSEPAIGQYEYLAEGSVGESISLKLTPGRQSGGINLGIVQVVGQLSSEGVLSGRWSSTIGTQGAFRATRFEDGVGLVGELPTNNSVFVVHGHDEGAKHAVARFLHLIGVQPVILQEQINRGRTVIEKFEDFAKRAGFAIVIVSPDDLGYPAGTPEKIRSRARQNVVLELGYFAAKLGREKTIVLVKGDVEMPSDVLGLAYEPMDGGEGWKMRVAKELKGAGFTIDLNKIV